MLEKKSFMLKWLVQICVECEISFGRIIKMEKAKANQSLLEVFIYKISMIVCTLNK